MEPMAYWHRIREIIRESRNHLNRFLYEPDGDLEFYKALEEETRYLIEQMKCLNEEIKSHIDELTK